MSAVTLKNLRKSYGDIEITKGVDLDIQSGEFVVFVGPSGCGKSTLLRMIAGLEEITSGDLYIGDKRVNDMPPVEREVGMVFQSYALYPHLTVAENMSFGLKLAKTEKQEIQHRVDAAAGTLQLTPLLERKPKELSGGQRQRVAIGRTMVREPEVLLFDEPLSNLDAGLRVKMRIEIAKLHKRINATMIYVTHDQVEAMTLADKIVVLKDGVIAQCGKPIDLYHYPENQFVAGFIGSPQMNFFQGKVESVSDQGALVQIANGVTLSARVDTCNLNSGDTVTLGCRPEHFVLDNSLPGVQGAIQVVERLGDQTLVYLEVAGADEAVVVRLEGDHAIRDEGEFRVGVHPDKCHVFDRNGQACRRLFKEPE